MTFDEYEALAAATDSDVGEPLVVAALGLAGEAGEFAEQVKKLLAQGHDLDRERLAAEAGDVLWYVAKAARALGVPLDAIAAANVAKLAARYPDGFTAQRSRQRGEP